jgi:hypothetical protein
MHLYDSILDLEKMIFNRPFALKTMSHVLVSTDTDINIAIITWLGNISSHHDSRSSCHKNVF